MPSPEIRRPGTEDCVDRFVRELEALGVETFRAGSVEEVRRAVAARVAGLRVLSWDPSLLPYRAGEALPDPILGDAPRDAQAAADVGVTGCDGAIAETGTLALLSGTGKSRAVSLLPPTHLALVRRGDVMLTMAEFFRVQADRRAAAASCTFVTGPSRTADIELTLTLGVHGPGKVMVVLGP
jgi:L-lactate dehydrogenase complex protein LldG